MKILLTLLLMISSICLAREVKLIVPYAIGGPNDRISRLLAHKLSNKEYTFILEYKLGAGGAIAATAVASTKNNTVLMVTSNGLIGAPLLNNTKSYDVTQDFILVKYLGTEPLLVVVKNNGVITNFQDLLTLSKTTTVPYGSGGTGTSGHLTGAIIAGTNKNFLHIPYKGASTVTLELLSGTVTWVTESVLSINEFIQDGRLRAIAVYSNKRIPQYPAIPTIRELGIDDRNFYRWHILVANQSADTRIIAYIQEQLLRRDIQEELVKLGLVDTSLVTTNQFFVQEYLKMKPIIDLVQ